MSAPNKQRATEAELAEAWFAIRHEAFERLTMLFRKEIAEKKLTQKELAMLLGMDEAQLNRTLKGRTNASLRTLANIAHVLNHKACLHFVPFHELPLANCSFEAVNGSSWSAPRMLTFEPCEGEPCTDVRISSPSPVSVKTSTRTQITNLETV